MKSKTVSTIPHHICRAIVPALAIASGVCAATPRATGPNLVVNGNFEDGRKDWSSGAKVVTDEVFEGKQAVVMDNRAGRKWYAIV